MNDIGILELSWHGNLLPSMIEIAATGNNNVTVITIEETWDSVKASPLVHTRNIQNKLIISQSELQSNAIDSIEKITKQLDFLWTVTPYGYPVIAATLLSLSFYCPSAAFVHEATLYSEENSSIIASTAEKFIKSRSFLDTIPDPLLAKINNQVKPKSYLMKYDLLVSIYPPVEKSINFMFPNINSDSFLPRYHKDDIDHTNNKLQLAVPGNVDTLIRDYDDLLTAIELSPELKEDMCIMLLGKLNRTSVPEIVTACRELSDQGFNIKFFNQRVPEQQYIRELNKSDILISPDRVHVNRNHRHVIRGQTKSTGAIGDAVQSGTPLLLPDNYCVPKQYDGLIHKYQSVSQLGDLIKRLTNSPMYRKSVQKSAMRVSEEFSIVQQANRFNQIRDRVIEIA